MNGPSPRLFERLEPPGGGPARLRDRLRRERLRARARRAAWGAAALFCLAAAAWIALGPSTTERPAAADDAYRLARIGLGLQPPPAEPLTIRAESRHHTAARRVPLSDERIVFYLVATLD